MNILKALREQSFIEFSGKLNIQLAKNTQLLGEVFMIRGLIAGCNYKNATSADALTELLLDDFSNIEDFFTCIEPELVKADKNSPLLELEIVEENFKTLINENQSLVKMKPPNEKKILINPKFLLCGEEVEPNEFEVLCKLSDFSKVRDIYQRRGLSFFQMTEALVGLRKKRALKVAF